MSPSSSSVSLPAGPQLVSLSAPASSQLNGQEVSLLKRRISALEEENAQICSKVSGKPIQTLSREGRAIQQLVAIVEPISDMIAEHDRQQRRVDEESVTLATIQTESTPEQERTFSNFQQLVLWCPTVAKLLDDGKFDIFTCRQLQTGADGARGDDTSTLKGEVIQWLAANAEPIEPPLSPRDKEGRGMNHFLTGRLLCPVDYDWEDASVRARIRNYDPDFRVTAHSWPLFLYEGLVYNPNSPSQGLFRSDLLIKGFKCIFTSPTSAQRHDGGDSAFLRKGPRPCTHVAKLLGMRTVQPRAIAYIAVQLRFALSSASSWAVVDDDFDYEAFYYNIVDYFEAPSSADKSTELNALLLWWNRIIFGRRNVADYRPLHPESLSVARSRK